MRRILVVGIGAGDPDFLTLQAVRALNRAEVFFLLDKGRRKRDLVDLREEMLRRHVERPGYRVVVAQDPPRAGVPRAGGSRGTGESQVAGASLEAGESPGTGRSRGLGDPGSTYPEAVEDWRRRRADVMERMIVDELPADGCGAFLVWGDPTLYDSTLGILEDILRRGRVVFEHEVIPGISCVSALAARHRVSLNRVGRPVEITPGRRLVERGTVQGAAEVTLVSEPDDSPWPTGTPQEGKGSSSQEPPPAVHLPSGVDDVVVMLDTPGVFAELDPEGIDVYWGAYLGTPDEMLVSGALAEVGPRIQELRERARAEKGWIMDTYLLRRGDDTGGERS